MFISLKPTRWWWSRSATAVIVAVVLSAGSWFGVAAVRAQQAGAQTIHETPVPRITTSGQADWPLHSLDVYGSRYSPLDEINASNVGNLALQWSFETPAADRISQITPVVVDGVMYFNSGSTLFAVNAMTGESVWTLKLEPGFAGGGRGPASGGGRVYAYGDTTMYAVDGATGELVASFGDSGRLQILNQALQFKYPDTFPPDLDPVSIGFRLVTPPVYFENTLYTGAAVSEGHIPGGLVIANDATTGAIKWVFNTVPQGPSDDGWEIVKDTWGSGARAGGGIWTPPAIDPELGLIYFNAGNPSPDYDGSARHGMNLFTNATIALDLETGDLAWYYQTVHHDLWDWDHVTGPVLFDVPLDNGRTLKGVGATGKNCLLYLWHRETGEPIHPMVETAVPTATDVPGEQVWPTQPIPYTARGVPMTPFCATYPLVEDPELAAHARQMYTPYSVDEHYVVAHGGSSWGPPAFSPRTGLLYVTGKNGAISFTVNPVGNTVEPGPGVPGHTDVIADRIDPGMTPTETVTAYDPATGDLAWQQVLPADSPISSSGNVATAGDVVFQGTTVGRFYAFDARSGDQLFLYAANRPIRASPLTYQVNGMQYISVVATNTVLTFGLP